MLPPNPNLSSLPNSLPPITTDESGSFSFSLPLERLLSLAGITIPPLPPTSSLSSSLSASLSDIQNPIPPLPKKIKFVEIKGIVVDVNTNEPIKGVKVTNSFFESDTTTTKGEFSIKHPNLKDTYLPPNKFPLKFSKNFKKPKYTKTQFIPYTSTGDIKLNAGIITMKPFESDLKKEIIEFLRFPKVEVDKITTKEVTSDFHVQKQLFKSIDDLKGIVIPLIIGMVAAYGVNQVKEIIEKAKLNKKSAFEDIKDIIACPPQDELEKIIKIKNKLFKILSSTEKTINKTLISVSIAAGIINIADIAYNLILTIPVPIAPGTPANVVLQIQDTKHKIKVIIKTIKHISNKTLVILGLLESVLTLILDMLKLLDLLIEFCNKKPSTEGDPISTQLQDLTTDQITQNNPIIIQVNGFKMGVETELNNPTYSIKRRRAIALNRQDVAMLKGEWSFSSIDQILIDELIFYIQKNDLTAD